MIYLLDVNVLLPPLDPRHPFNSVAHQWFDRVVIGPDDRWATCALTENGYLRGR